MGLNGHLCIRDSTLTSVRKIHIRTFSQLQYNKQVYIRIIKIQKKAALRPLNTIAIYMLYIDIYIILTLPLLPPPPPAPGVSKCTIWYTLP